MIAKLKGIIDEISDDFILLDVNGVCYQLFCSSRSLNLLPKLGEEAVLFTEMVVREDFIKLYGFATKEEKFWFNILTEVQGVGAKVALAILSTFSPDEINSAIALEDKAAMSRPLGVGQKLAQRIISELKGKVADISTLNIAHSNLQSALNKKAASNNAKDAISALSNLGYSSIQASATIARIIAKEGEEVEVAKLIRLGLRELSK